MKFARYFTLTAGVLGSLNACNPLKTEPVPDPNFATVASFQTNATKGQLDNLAIGQIALSRAGIHTYLRVVGTLGKELFNFNTTESRWMTELNGLRPLDNSAFYNNATVNAGLPVRQANILLASVDATNAVAEEQKNGYRGLANTFKGLAYLYMLNVQGSNGVRLSTEDPFKPSKPASYSESLAGIAKILDDGAAQLDKAGASFAFTMPAGFRAGVAGAEFGTPPTFKQFNRAIALRVAIYQSDWAKAATLLPQTFYNPTGDLSVGPKHTFSATPPDVANPLINTATVRIVGVQKMWDEIEPGDKRLAKVRVLASPANYTSGVTYSTKYIQNLYTTANDVVPIIKNEELVLIAAEIAAQQGNVAEATKNINIVRANAGLGAYAGATTKDDLINAILKERLYSLFYEGHRWVDMRRYNKLGEIYLPVAGMKVLEHLDRPVAEVNWDLQNP